MPSVFLANSLPSYVAIVVITLVISGIIAVAIHHSMTKYNIDGDGKPRFDSEGAWMFLAIILIPIGVIIWALLTVLWPTLIQWGIDLLDWIDTW